MRLLVVNGPNLNLLGTREPAVYGNRGYAELERLVTEHAARIGCEVELFQSNHEGELIDFLQRSGPDAHGIVLNAGALTHYSYALYDCLQALGRPVVEVHISNIHAREGFRQRSVTAPAAAGVITGFGFRGYMMAMEYLIDRDQ